MQSPLNPRRILVRGTNWLGDAVMTTPALLRLREHFPDALIALLTPAKLQGLWLHHPAIDEIITFKSDEGALAVARKIKVVMWPEAKDGGPRAESRPAKGGAFDLALVLPNSPRSALEMWLARVPQRVGYARPWRSFLLTTAIAPRPEETRTRKRSLGEINQLISAQVSPDASPPETAHQVHDYLHLVGALGANPDPIPPQIVVTPGEERAVARKFNLEQEIAGGRLILGLNPGAEYGPAKRWPADRFIAAARHIQQRTNCLWLVFGGGGDALVAGEIEAAIGAGHAVNLAGKTSLRELCATIRLCRLLLTNDTGPMHVAAALGVPVVVPFGSTSPELTGPISSATIQHRLIKSNAPCAPCFLRDCPIDFRCMNGIGVEDVVGQIAATLNCR